ncbi:protein O-mannosyl-transferase TMTC3 [Octopus vulgaris]|uniref:Protein O-mannosyl-transferase TMTC3 n=1 Tax=Octopus vulgaris TaxID=6645 RepID=A0AA36FM22_OCTVU|nr:protein O-mannosyl-transferase TMTC3 [Octopus vulgaris]
MVSGGRLTALPTKNTVEYFYVWTEANVHSNDSIEMNSEECYQKTCSEVVNSNQLLSLSAKIYILRTFGPLAFLLKEDGEEEFQDWWFLLLTLLFVVAAMLSKEQGITVVGVCCVYEIVIAQKITPQGILKDFANICKGKISFPAWLRTSVLRGTFLVGSTLFLLLARIKIMGAELPVFTKTLKMVLWGLMVFLLTVHGLKTIIRNFDWQSEYILFKSAVKVNQRNAKLFNNIGHALEKTSNWSEALEYFTFAAKVQPDDIGAHINVGRTYQHLNMSKEAEKAFQTAIDLFPPVIQGKSYTARVAPSHLNAFLNLASLISKNESRLKEAEKLYKSAITMRADYVKAYMSRGEVLVRLGRLEEAKEQYRIALHYEQSDADIYYNIGVVNLEQKNLLEANTFFEQALRLNPDHQQTLFNSALLLQDLGDPVYRPEAMRRLLHLLELKPNDAKAYYCLAILAADNKEFTKAKNWFQEAIRLEDTMRSALFNLALMLVNDLKQPQEAIPYLQKLLMYYPNHTKGLILMGDININILKDLDGAEKNFLTILMNEPGNVQAIHNLCVVYVERGDILKAEKCLQHAHRLAPSESYILQHLNIVRNKIKAIKAKKKPQ